MIVDKATKEKPVQKKPKQSGIKKSVKGGQYKLVGIPTASLFYYL